MIIKKEGHSTSRNISVNDFSGGDLGLPGGACGLLAVAGDFSLDALLKAARCLQYRGRTGAGGVTLKSLYKDTGFFNFHIMFRSEDKISELDEVISSMGGLRILEKKDMVERKFYYEYDLPVIMHYSIVPPSPEEMMFRERIKNEQDYVSLCVTRFNKKYIDDARIFFPAPSTTAHS